MRKCQVLSAVSLALLLAKSLKRNETGRCTFEAAVYATPLVTEQQSRCLIKLLAFSSLLLVLYRTPTRPTSKQIPAE